MKFFKKDCSYFFGLHTVSIFVWSVCVLGVCLFFDAASPKAHAETIELTPLTSETGLNTAADTNASDTKQFLYTWSEFISDALPAEANIDIVALHLVWTQSEVTDGLVVDPVNVSTSTTDESSSAADVALSLISPEENQSSSSDSITENPTSTNEEIIRVTPENIVKNGDALDQDETSSTLSDEIPEQDNSGTSSGTYPDQVAVPVESQKQSLLENILSAVSDIMYPFVSLSLWQSHEEITDSPRSQSSDVDQTNTDNTASTSLSTSTRDEVSLQNTFGVFYSLDGLSWQNIGTIESDTARDALVNIPISSVSDIANLQVKIQSLSQADLASVGVPAVSIEIRYSETPQTVVVPVDQLPNFDISTIKNDVTVGNIRAVTIEKGGMLELWYALIDSSSQTRTWKQLAGDASIDEGSSLAIKGRTLFWLDKNQQTLFGFNVDKQSLFGNAKNDDVVDNFSLDFTDTQVGNMKATFDASDNSFSFVRR